MAELEEDEAPDERAGRRCAVGCESWPDDEQYNPCPRCGLPTKRYSNLLPLSDEEALSIANQIDFEDFLEQEWPDKREEWLAENESALLTDEQLEALTSAS